MVCENGPLLINKSIGLLKKSFGLFLIIEWPKGLIVLKSHSYIERDAIYSFSRVNHIIFLSFFPTCNFKFPDCVVNQKL